MLTLAAILSVATFALLARTAPAPTATPAPSVAPAPTLTPAPSVAPSPTPTMGTSVRVTSIPALLTALANNSIDEIVVANGTYHVSPSGQLKADSLWIGGDKMVARTRPITVRAETIGGVTLDGSGNSGAYGAL